jgi:hypothetical protein
MPYDVEMIRDFIDHLKWSLRVDHFELTNGPDALNPELVDQVEHCMVKHGIPRLLPIFGVEPDRPGLTSGKIKEAMRRVAAYLAEKRQEQLRNLEALEEVLNEAYAHAVGQVIEIAFPASKILDGSFFSDKDPGPGPG